MSVREHTGGCLCGAVRYKLCEDENTLKNVSACHCSQCRRWSGHYWSSISGPLSGFVLTKGENKIGWYASSKTARRGFCKNCGSALFWHGHGIEACKNKMDVSCGSLDDSTGISLTRHIFCADKGKYYELHDSVKTFDTH